MEKTKKTTRVAKAAPKEKAEAVLAQSGSASGGKTGKITGLASRVFLRRHHTEKTTLQEQMGQYTFAVAPGANKVMVAEAVRELYGVKPVRVTMVRLPGKEVRRGKQVGRRSDLRKAIVTLKPGTVLPGAEAK